MNLARMRTLVSGGFGALLLVFGAGVAGAQTGTITGSVTGSGEAAGALEGARVTVQGTNIAAFTNREGVYTLRNVGAGTVQVRVVRLGYDQGTQAATVTAGQTTTLDFVLASSPFTLDEIVTTATGDTRKAELGNVVSVIQVDELAREAPIKNMSELLNSRAPGVTVIQSSGVTGGGTRIRIRGSNSVSLSNEPLLVVDGIRMESGASSSRLGLGGQAPSRINDINPDEIESVEIVKGPSAAALYGTSAANGVILITTKRGTAGRPRWNAWTEQGILKDETDYPDNFRGLDASGSRCGLPDQGRGACTIASIATFNPMLDPTERPIANGYRRQYGMSVSGGSEQAQYFLSAEQEWEDGIWEMPDAEVNRILTASGRPSLRDVELNPNQQRKTNLRANINSQVSSKANVAISMGFVDSRTFFNENDNNINGILSSALNGRGDAMAGDPNAWGFFRPGETFQQLNVQRIRRLTMSAQTNYNFTDWLTGRAIVGIDYTNRVDNQNIRFGEGPDFSTQKQGRAQEDPRNIIQYSADLGTTATFNLTGDLTSKTSVGVQWFKNSFKGTTAFGQFLPPGSVTIGSGSVQNASEVTVESITLGSFAEQVFGYKDRLFVTGAVRGDRNSTFGANFGTKIYPKAAISYLISDESFFPTGKVLTSLRLRGAWGKSGLQPGTTAALVFFNPITAAAPDGSDQAGVVLGGFGNANLTPETAREFEGGFDVNLFDSRIALEMTYFDKKSTDGLLNTPTPLSVGSPNGRFQNLTSVSNKGLDITLNAQVLTARNLSWDATFTGSFIRNRLLDLGGQAPVNLSGTTQQARVGTPLGAYWARTVTGWTDSDGDGIIEGSEVSITDTLEIQGNTNPTREVSLATGVNLFNNKVRLSAQADYRGGHLLYNLNEDFRCRARVNCVGLYDQNASEFERLRVIALTQAGAKNTADLYIEDAEFFKLREVSATFTAPDSWVRGLRVDRLSLTLSGRNLWTETNYTGLDPELNGQGNGNFAAREFLTQPPTRQFSARLNVGF